MKLRPHMWLRRAGILLCGYFLTTTALAADEPWKLVAVALLVLWSLQGTLV